MIAALVLGLALQARACDTIGWANHNPTNLTSCHRRWPSAIGVDQGDRLIFSDDATGIHVAYKVLKNYNRRYHIHSIEHLCGRWINKGASWKEKKCWIDTVRKYTHTKPGARLLFTDPEMAILILKGICYAENSCDDLPDAAFRRAVLGR